MIFVHSVPVYWGVERDAPDRSFLTRATLDEVLPPYRYSNRAIRLRVSRRLWLHIGVCHYKNEVTPWGYEISPEYIGGWRAKPLPQADHTSEAVSAGPAERGGLVPGAGDVPDPVGGTVPGSEPPGDRDALVAHRDAAATGDGHPGHTGITEAG